MLPTTHLYMFDCFFKPMACADLGIKQYPTMILFAHRQRHVFRQPYHFDSTIEWLENNVFVHSQAIIDVSQVRRLLDKVEHRETSHFVFFCGGTHSARFKQFDLLSRERQQERYYYSADEQIWRLLNCTESETLYINKDGVQRDGHLSGKSYSVERFVLSKRYPNVKILNHFHYKDFFADA